MTHVGTEGLSLFEGAALRDAALAQSAEGRTDHILAVRTELMRRHQLGMYPEGFTGDDVMDIVESLGLDDGDHRWTGSACKGWAVVSATVHFVTSRRKERHAAPLRVWRFR